MKVVLQRKNKAVHFEGTNESGLKVNIDGAEEVGGEGKGVRPMELVLFSLGSCSAIDIASILRKMNLQADDIKITIEGERDPDEVPSVFTKINVHYTLVGKLYASKVERAIELSMEKYCSVAKMLRPTVELTYSYEILRK